MSGWPDQALFALGMTASNDMRYDSAAYLNPEQLSRCVGNLDVPANETAVRDHISYLEQCVEELLKPRKLTIYTRGGRIAYQALVNPKMPEMLWNADSPIECWGFRVEQM